jgi:plasmid stabilization system protein ParE
MAIQSLTIHDAAQSEFQYSYQWYESRQKGLGSRFADAVRNRLNSLWENPHQGKQSRKGFREILVDDTFPFLIVFRLLENETNLFISAIYHTKRNPRGKYRSKDY